MGISNDEFVTNTLNDRTVVITFHRRVILAEVAEEAFSLAMAAGRSNFIVSFENVTTLGPVVTKLILLQKQLSEKRGHLILCNLNATLTDVFKITNMNRVFEIEPDLASAVARFPVE